MSDRYRFGRVEVRCAERQLLLDGEPAKPGPRAFELLLALVERRERVISKSEPLDLRGLRCRIDRLGYHGGVERRRRRFSCAGGP
jgi:hypothetical protein